MADSGLELMSVCEAKLEEEEPRTLLKDTGFEDQCAKLNNHPAKYFPKSPQKLLTSHCRMMLLRGEQCEDTLRKYIGEGEGSLREKFRYQQSTTIY